MSSTLVAFILLALVQLSFGQTFFVSNLPTFITVSEGATTTSVCDFTLVCNDASCVDYDVTVSPGTGASKFVDPPSGSSLLTCSSAPYLIFDADAPAATTIYYVTVTPKDAGGVSGISSTLTVIISQADEPPYFSSSSFFHSTTEAGLGSSIGWDASTYCTEPEGQTRLYSSDSSSIQFNPPTSGNALFAVDYDIDGGLLPTFQSITVYCSDGPTKGSTMLNLEILDKNDNSPEFTFDNQDLYNLTNALPGTFSLSVVASDSDAARLTNGRVSYYMGTTGDSNYFGFDDPFFPTMKLQAAYDKAYNTPGVVEVWARDNPDSGTALSTSITFSVQLLSPYAPAVATTAAPSPAAAAASGPAPSPSTAQVGDTCTETYCDPIFIALMSLGGLAVLIAGGVGGIYAYKKGSTSYGAKHPKRDAIDPHVDRRFRRIHEHRQVRPSRYY